MCLTSKSVQNYYNPNGRDPSTIVETSNPSLGISNIQITQSGNWLICEFKRLKQYPSLNTQYFDLKNQFYVLGAFGNTDGSGEY